jgi:small-conductance mechanosensitive channel
MLVFATCCGVSRGVAMETVDGAPYALTERRIAHLTLVLGAIAAIGACFLFTVRVGAGVLIGALLAWVNFRWLKSALDTVLRAATSQPESSKARVPIGSLFGLIGRYLLIAVSVCVIFIFFRIPVLSMLVGLCALGAATIGASLYEVFRSWE